MSLQVALHNDGGTWRGAVKLVDASGVYDAQCSEEIPAELIPPTERLAAEVGTDKPFDHHHPAMPHGLFLFLDDLLDTAAEGFGEATQRDDRHFVQQAFALMADTNEAAKILGVKVSTIHRELARARVARAEGRIPTGGRPWLGIPEPDLYRGRTPLWHAHRLAEYVEDAPHRSARRTGRPKSA